MGNKTSDELLKINKSDYSPYFLGTGSAFLNKICNNNSDLKIQKSCAILQKLFVEQIFRNYNKKINNTYHCFLNKMELEEKTPKVIMNKNYIQDIINENVYNIAGTFRDFTEEKENLHYIYSSMNKKNYNFYVDTNFFGIKKYQELCKNKSDEYYCKTLSKHMTLLFSKFIKGNSQNVITDDDWISGYTREITYQMYHLDETSNFSKKKNEIGANLDFIEAVLDNQVKFNKEYVYEDRY